MKVASSASIISILLLIFPKSILAQDQTDVQANIWENVAAVARTVSPNAASEVMSLFESNSTLYWLTELDDGSELYKVPPSDLYDMFFNELSVSELVHNFGHVNDGEFLSLSAYCMFIFYKYYVTYVNNILFI